MANRFPLIVNANSLQIQELPESDNLNLNSNNIVNANNLQVVGIATCGSINIGSNQVISSARQLQNIASLDATTLSTIETAIANEPNNFDDLSVAGLGTISQIQSSGVNVSGVVTTTAGTLGSNGNGTRYVSTGDPTGGSNGDIWYKVIS